MLAGHFCYVTKVWDCYMRWSHFHYDVAGHCKTVLATASVWCHRTVWHLYWLVTSFSWCRRMVWGSDLGWSHLHCSLPVQCYTSDVYWPHFHCNATEHYETVMWGISMRPTGVLRDEPKLVPLSRKHIHSFIDTSLVHRHCKHGLPEEKRQPCNEEVIDPTYLFCVGEMAFFWPLSLIAAQSYQSICCLVPQ